MKYTCRFCGQGILTGDLDGDGDPEIGECDCPAAVKCRAERDRERLNRWSQLEEETVEAATDEEAMS